MCAGWEEIESDSPFEPLQFSKKYRCFEPFDVPQIRWKWKEGFVLFNFEANGATVAFNCLRLTCLRLSQRFRAEQ